MDSPLFFSLVFFLVRFPVSLTKQYQDAEKQLEALLNNKQILPLRKQSAFAFRLLSRSALFNLSLPFLSLSLSLVC
jgi:hypothetical protein